MLQSMVSSPIPTRAEVLDVADFHAQIAARHHHHVAGVDDLDQILDGFGAFDFRDQRGGAAGGARDAARFVHVGGVAAETHGDEISVELRGDLDQFAVAFGQRAQRQTAAEFVEALAVRQFAVVEHCGDDARAFDRGDLQLHHAVVEQQRVAGDDIAGQAEITHADLMLVAKRCVFACDQIEALAGAQLHFVVGEFLDADLRSGQIGEDADFCADALRSRAHGFGAGDLRGRIAVREIEPDHIHARAQQRVEDARGVGGGAEGGEDLGAAALFGRGLLRRALRGRALLSHVDLLIAQP